MSSPPSEAAAIVAALEPHLPLPLGTLRVWGDWFGKPLDNLHLAVEARSDADRLLLTFHRRERLVVHGPRDWTVDPTAPGREPRLVIRSADRVEWGWFFYGHPEVPENWVERHHWREGRTIRASTTLRGDVSTFSPSIEEPSVTFI